MNLKKKIISYLKSNYNIKVVDKLYVFLNPSILKNVLYHQHLLTPLTNGNPYLLYLVRVDGVNCCFYIDRKLKNGYQYPKIHYVNYQFHDSLFEGTIFSGELVRDNDRKWFYLIDNLLLYKGENMSKKNIVCRFENIYNIFNNEYTQNNSMEICSIQIKKLFHYQQIKTLVNKFIPSLSYRCKGLLFYNLNNKYSNYALIFDRNNPIIPITKDKINELIKINKHTLWAKLTQDNDNINSFNTTSKNTETTVIENQEDKNKMLSNDNIVFKVINTDMPDIYNLYIHNSQNNEIMKYDLALVPNMKTSKYLREVFESKSNILDIKMECRYSKIFQKWAPIREVDMPVSNLLDMENIIQNLA